MSNLLYRVLAPVPASSPVAAHGRTYSPAAASFTDCVYGDAATLASNGWTILGRVGTTAQRPLANVNELHPAVKLDRYIDTTLGKEIVFDGVQWRDPVTGSVV